MTELEISNEINTLLYIGEDGAVGIKVILDEENETMWATQKTMAELFNVKKNTISYHLKNIFADDELDENSVVRKIRTTASDGKTYENNFYIVFYQKFIPKYSLTQFS